MVTVRQFLERCTFGAAAGLHLLRVGEFRAAAHALSSRLCPASASAVRVRIRSRSTSAKRPSTAIISRPVLVPVSAHGPAGAPHNRSPRRRSGNLLHSGSAAGRPIPASSAVSLVVSLHPLSGGKPRVRLRQIEDRVIIPVALTTPSIGGFAPG